MTQIAELAYKVKFDARELTKGLLSTRQQVAASKKIMTSMQSPLERFVAGMDNLRAISARYTEVAKHAHKIGDQLERQYLEEQKALTGLNREQQRRLEILTQEERIAAKTAKSKEDRAKKLEADRIVYREGRQRQGAKRQTFFAQIEQDSADARAALAARLAAFKKQKRATEKQNAIEAAQALEEQRKRAEAEKAALLAARQRQGAKKQAFFAQIEQEAADARAALAKRLAAFKKQKADEARAAGEMQKAEAAAQAKLDAAARTRQLQIARGAGLRQQARLSAIDAQQAAGRAALAERLARFKSTGMTDQQAAAARARGPIVDQFAAADHFGRFNPSLASQAIASGRSRSRARSQAAMNDGGSPSPFAFGVKAFGGAMAAKAVLDTASAVRTLAHESTELYADLERTSAAFEVFTGSSAKTKVLIADMKRLSAISGVTFSALNFGASTMMGYGEATDDAIAKLKQMAAITRGDSERLKAMAFAMGQVRGNGKLMAQELLQMINAGFNPLAEIARTSGKDMAYLRSEMEAGRITVDMVSNSLKTATEEGGRYTGMLENIAKTTAGVRSQNQAAWEQAKADIGEALAPLTEMQARLSTGFAQSLSQTASLFKRERAGEETPAVDPRQAARDRRIAATAARKSQEQEAFKAIDKAREDMKKAGIDRLAGLTADELRGSVSEEQYSKFTRILSLLDEANRKQATIDFAEYRNLETIYGYLDEEVQLELRKLETLEKQNEAREREEKLLEAGKELTERYSPVAKFQSRLQEIEQLLQAKAINPDIADQERFSAMQEFGADSEAARKRQNEMAMSRAQAEIQRQEARLAAATKARKEAEDQMPRRRFDTSQNQAVDRRMRQDRLNSAGREENIARQSLAAAMSRMAMVAAEAGLINTRQPVASMEVGSDAAAKYLAELKGAPKVQEKQLTELQKNNELQKQTLIAQQQTNTKLDKLAEVSPRKVR